MIVIVVNVQNFLFIRLCNLRLLRNTQKKIPRAATGTKEETMEAKTLHFDVWRKRESKIFGECFGIEL